jgi:hypothetical protein
MAGMNEITCSHGNGPECSKCEALDIPEVEELERELRARIADLEAERDKCNGLLQGYITTLAECVVKRDAARAGEARAVEALKQGRVLAQKVVGETWDLAGSFTDKEQALFDWVEDLDWPRYPTPALDWLAQREREAVLAWLDSKAETDNGERADIGPWCREQAAALRPGKGERQCVTQ